MSVFVIRERIRDSHAMTRLRELLRLIVTLTGQVQFVCVTGGRTHNITNEDVEVMDKVA